MSLTKIHLFKGPQTEVWYLAMPPDWGRRWSVDNGIVECGGTGFHWFPYETGEEALQALDDAVTKLGSRN